jgi:glucosamine--fructose-6-phosphate aminotransferase (isomerizing)
VPGQRPARPEPGAQSRGWSERFAKRDHALFLGRGIHYPIALEGALKLKEISYIHAEAYPAGELKHGPLALVDASMPVVVIAPNDTLLEKVKSNMQEVRARGGELYVFADLDSHFTESEGVHVIRTPRHAGVLSPIVHCDTGPVAGLPHRAAARAPTSTSRATWPNPSRWSSPSGSRRSEDQGTVLRRNRSVASRPPRRFSRQWSPAEIRHL